MWTLRWAEHGAQSRALAHLRDAGAVSPLVDPGASHRPTAAAMGQEQHSARAHAALQRCSRPCTAGAKYTLRSSTRHESGIVLPGRVLWTRRSDGERGGGGFGCYCDLVRVLYREYRVHVRPWYVKYNVQLGAKYNLYLRKSCDVQWINEDFKMYCSNDFIAQIPSRPPIFRVPTRRPAKRDRFCGPIVLRKCTS